MPSVLNIADFGKDAIDSGRVDGKIYGVSLGSTRRRCSTARRRSRRPG